MKIINQIVRFLFLSHKVSEYEQNHNDNNNKTKNLKFKYIYIFVDRYTLCELYICFSKLRS